MGASNQKSSRVEAKHQNTSTFIDYQLSVRASLLFLAEAKYSGRDFVFIDLTRTDKSRQVQKKKKLFTEDMEKRERAVCGTLCLCLAIAVMSTVALVYLTVIIYLPSQREMTSGMNEVPVMCTQPRGK